MTDTAANNYRRFLDGDTEAFNAIMEELFGGLVAFLDRYVSDRHTAEDIALDTFSDLVVYPRRYNFKVSLKTYLYMRAKHRAIDYIRHRRVVQFTDLAAAEHTACGTVPEDAVMADARARAVNAAVATLPRDMRAAVHLVYFEDMSYSEAAAVLHKSVKQVDNLLYRAKKALRDLLGEEGLP